MNTRVCAIVVTFNRLETLKTAIAHVLAQVVKPAEIVIVDNNSTDGTQEYLRSLQGENNIHCIFMESNTGSAGAISKGMTYGLAKNTFDYFWIMDDDTFYAPNALKDLIENIEETPFVMLGLHGANFRMGKKVKVKPNIKLQEAEYAMIDGAIIKADVVRRIGTVCEDFFMMCDDHEYSIRIRKNGFRLGVLKNGADDRRLLGGGEQFTKTTLWRGYYSARNHTFIIKKHFSLPEFIAYVYHQAKLLIITAILAPDRYQRVKFRLMGLWHGIKDMGGRTLDPDTLEFVTDEKASREAEKFKSPEPGYINAGKAVVTSK
ncbi:glycosyltransferase [Longitalea arenae]|uniref:glycosyltransferase n=1 Tax=Longitalea arenae TaxID=2812558 RepID=UPI001967D6A0|nr:glycosyltransferase [Longitalea arenae]